MQTQYQPPEGIGTLHLYAKRGKLARLDFAEQDLIADTSGAPEDELVLAQTITQLDEYFAGKRKTFDIPLLMEGTDFRVKVWDALLTIPYGQSISYKELAERLGSPKAVRAVGGANHHNPIPIIVPCHRVIGANGSLTGYGGGLDRKDWLLRFEKSYL